MLECKYCCRIFQMICAHIRSHVDILHLFLQVSDENLFKQMNAAYCIRFQTVICIILSHTFRSISFLVNKLTENE